MLTTHLMFLLVGQGGAPVGRDPMASWPMDRIFRLLIVSAFPVCLAARTCAVRHKSSAVLAFALDTVLHMAKCRRARRTDPQPRIAPDFGVHAD